jgi:hypothetical protein
MPAGLVTEEREMNEPVADADLLERIAAVVKTEGGTISRQESRALIGTLTAIKSKWLLGGRKVTDTVTCRLVPEAHEVHLREVAVETSWGLPPPTFTVKTTVQSGARVTSKRTETAAGGGGRLEFGRFRDAVAEATREAGWAFVYDIP